MIYYLYLFDKHPFSNTPMSYTYVYYIYMVDGLEHEFYMFPFSWESLSQLTKSYFSEGLKPMTSVKKKSPPSLLVRFPISPPRTYALSDDVPIFDKKCWLITIW